MSFTQGHALLIGVGTHQHHPDLNVPITTTDARAVQAVLQNPQLCGYPNPQVTLLTNEQATTAGILAALDKLATLAADQTVFLFFAGHGDFGTDGQYHLFTHDVRLTRINGFNRVVIGTGISEQVLLEKLRALPVKRCLMIFNTCHSGAIGPGTLGVNDEFPHNQPSQQTRHALLGTGEGRILLMASKEEQLSYFVHGEPNTIFTQKLVGALKGDGGGRGGYVGVFGLYEYLYHEVKEAVQKTYQKVQEPVLTAIQAVGSFPVALHRGAGTLSAFGEATDGLAETAAEFIPASKAERALRQVINIGGGAYIAGNVNMGGGDFIGRDQSIGGDYVRGDKIGRDQYNVGQGAVVAKGDHARSYGAGATHVEGSEVKGNIIGGSGNRVNIGGGVDEVAAAFDKIQRALAEAPLSNAQKTMAKTAVEQLQAEADKGEQAQEAAVQDWLTLLKQMAPDIAEVALQTFLSPVRGLSLAFQKVAQKIRTSAPQ